MRQDSASQLFEANAMRGADVQQGGLFSHVSVESRVPANHPLRAVRTLPDEALASMSRDFDRVYAEGGRSSVPPERLVRALVLQVLYSIRSERLQWDVRRGMSAILNHPWIPTSGPDAVTVRGFIYDVDTGLLEEVSYPGPAGSIG
jgi:hypothetical protein